MMHLGWGWLNQIFPVARWVRERYSPPLTIELCLRSDSPGTQHPYVPSVSVTLCGSHREAKLVEGSIWLLDSDNPAYKEEKHLPETEMPKGKIQHFILTVKIPFYDRVVTRQTTLKLGYDFAFKRLFRKPYKQSGTYAYNQQKQIFEKVH